MTDFPSLDDLQAQYESLGAAGVDAMDPARYALGVRIASLRERLAQESAPPFRNPMTDRPGSRPFRHLGGHYD